MELQTQPYQAFTSPIERLSPDLKVGLRLLTHNDGKKFVVREYHGGTYQYDEKYPSMFMGGYQEILEYGEKIASEFKDLQASGVKLPPFYMVAGTDEVFERLHLYMAVEFVEGFDLHRYWHDDNLSTQAIEKIAKEYNGLIIGLINYYTDRFTDNKPALEDISHIRQYRINNEHEVCLIDTDYSLLETNRALAWNLVSHLFEMAVDLGLKFNQKGPWLDPSFARIEEFKKQFCY